MADIFRYLNRPKDELDYADWLLGREAERADRPHWLELPSRAEDNSPAFEPSTPREVRAKQGDSISKILGTNDPVAIGAFARANGLKRGNSTIYAGRSYVVPNDLSGSANDRGEGLLMIRRDNARRAELQAQRARDEALRQARAQEAELGLDQSRYMPRYGQARAFTPPTETTPSLTDEGLEPRLTDAARTALTRLPPAWDHDPRARALASLLAREAGQDVGYVTGTLKTAKDTVKGGLTLASLIDPLAVGTPEGIAASNGLLRGILGAKDYTESRLQNLDLLHQDVSEGWRRFREAHDPSATAPAESLADEIQRQFKIAKNDSELGVAVGSLLVPGGVLKGAGLLGKGEELTGAAKWIAKGFTPAQAEYLAMPYEGMGHHFWRRAGIDLPLKDAATGKSVRLKLPQWISDSAFNVKKPRGINRGDLYELHYKVDPSFQSANLPRRVGRGVWVGKRLGYEKYGPLGMIWYGSPTPLKIATGGAAAAPGLLSYKLTKEEAE